MGWDPKLGLWQVAIKWKLNFACMLLSSDMPQSLICTINGPVNRYILTREKLGVFGWYCCLEGCSWVNQSHSPGRRCLCAAFNSLLAVFFLFWVIINKTRGGRSIIYHLLLIPALWQKPWPHSRENGRLRYVSFRGFTTDYNRFHKPFRHDTHPAC